MQTRYEVVQELSSPCYLGRAMIPRYTPSEYLELWSPRTKYETWFDVELAACRAMEQHDLVPKGTADSVAPFRDKLNPDRIDEIELTTKHDIIAFLTHVEELAGPNARWLHLGMTSSDVLDTSFALLLWRAATGIETRLKKVLAAFEKRIREHRHTKMIGRSHGIYAEPITFGVVLAGHYAELARGLVRLRTAIDEVRYGKISGAVGTYGHLPLEVERDALTELGLRPETIATQVVPRDRHAAFASALSLIAAGIERFATNVRHWQRTDVLEAEEPFTKGQKGSSAMPHKRNPILSENLCGLARVVRAGLVPAMENIALWHERDISHSSVERMMFPDMTATLAFMLDRTERLIDGLVVYPDKMLANLTKAKELWASEGILLALVRKGIPRQEAYVWVQRNAMKTFDEGASFSELLAKDADIKTHLTTAEVNAVFSLEHATRHADAMIDRALMR